MAQALPGPPSGFDDLPVEEKVDYVQSLWDRIAEHPETVPVPAWHQDVIAERLAAHSATAAAAVAGRTASESPWQGGVRELVRGFLVLRDLFSYALPGAAFLAIGLWSRGPGPIQLINEIRASPAWAVVLVGLFASYLTGHCLLAAYHLPSNIRQLLRRSVSGAISLLSAEELRCRGQAPELFVEFDRHRIIHDMRRGLALALVVGVIVFRWWPDHWWQGSLEWLLMAGGLVIWISALSGTLRGRQLSAITLQAASDGHC